MTDHEEGRGCVELYAGAFDRVEARTRQKVPQRFHPKLLNEKKPELLPSLLNFVTSYN